MLSLSDNEFSVLNFLVRNFTERLTIRTIAQKLKFSPAGVHTILKKLEKQGIVYGEKLGTGLFYKINLESKTAYHLAAAVLAGFFDFSAKELEKYRGSADALLFDGKNALFIVGNISSLNVLIENVNVIVKSQDEFVESIRKREPEILQILKNSTVVFGEEIVLSMIKKFTERF